MLRFELHGRILMQYWRNSLICDHLDAVARIVNDPQIKAGILKMQGRHGALTKVLEKQEVSGLLMNMDGNEENREAVSSIIELSAKWLRTSDSTKPSAYMDIRFLLPSSNMRKVYLYLGERNYKLSEKNATREL